MATTVTATETRTFVWFDGTDDSLRAAAEELGLHVLLAPPDFRGSTRRFLVHVVENAFYDQTASIVAEVPGGACWIAYFPNGITTVHGFRHIHWVEDDGAGAPVGWTVASTSS